MNTLLATDAVSNAAAGGASLFVLAAIVFAIAWVIAWTIFPFIVIDRLGKMLRNTYWMCRYLDDLRKLNEGVEITSNAVRAVGAALTQSTQSSAQ